MKVLHVLKPYMTDHEATNQVGASLAAIKIGEAQRSLGIEVGYVVNADIGHEPRYSVPVSRFENKEMVLKAVEVYEAEGYDILNFHAFTHTPLKMIDKYVPDHIPVVVTIHIASNLGRGLFLASEEIKSLASKPNVRLVGVSYSAVLKGISALVGHYDRMCTIPNVIEAPACLYNVEKEYELMAVGRLVPGKEMKEVAEVMKALKLPCLIVGSEPVSTGTSNGELEYAKEVVEIIESAPNITWIRSVNYQELFQLYYKSKYMLNLSHMESFGMTLAESALAGTPTIAFHSELYDEVLGFSGYLKLDRNLHYRKVWKNKIQIILNQVLDRIKEDKGEMAKNLPMSNHQLQSEVIAVRYLNLYKELVPTEDKIATNI